MRIIVLGANAAFTTGIYQEAVTYQELIEVMTDYAKNIAQTKRIISAEKFLKNRKLNTERLYAPRWQSNFVLEFENNLGKRKDNKYRLAFDFGSDFRHSLLGVGLKLADIDGYYVSHPHNDHIGGIEYIALSSFFNPFYTQGKAEWLKEEGHYISVSEKVSRREELGTERKIPADFKPDLYGHPDVLKDLWKAAQPGLHTIQGVLSNEMKIDLYFNVFPIQPDDPIIVEDDTRTWKMYIVPTTHVLAGYGKFMPSYGLLLKSSDGKQILMPSDTQFMNPQTIRLFYYTSDAIYQDCETGPKSDVHPHIDDLRNDSSMTPEIKKKCWLYHYNQIPEIEDGEFAGILQPGDIHEY